MAYNKLRQRNIPRLDAEEHCRSGVDRSGLIVEEINDYIGKFLLYYRFSEHMMNFCYNLVW